MTAPVIWIVLGLLIWTAAQGIAVWYVVRHLRRKAHPATLPSPLAILEDRVATGNMTQQQFTKAATALRHYNLDR